MGLFSRKPPEAPAPTPTLKARRPVVHCFGCNRRAEIYVYMENGHDYCVPCARNSYGMMGLRPVGRRPDDITLADLLAQ